MESMPAPISAVTVGVDTHLETHVAAVVDQAGRLLDTNAFAASTRGYVALVTWAEGFGPVERIGIEGTGTYGAGLARFARAYGLQVLEVDRPDRSTRRRRGKSDPIDAQAAARATLAGVAATTPKTRDGQVEMIRVLRVARRGALKPGWRPPSNSTASSTAPPKSSANPCSASRPKPWSAPVRSCGPGP
jgi:transposase